MRHQESLYLRWTAAETRCRDLARQLYGKARSGHPPTENELRELAEAAASACELFRLHLAQVLAASGEDPAVLLPVEEPSPAMAAPVCPTCARIAAEPTGDWEAELAFLGADRRTRRLLHFHWQCRECGAVWCQSKSRTGGTQEWSLADQRVDL